MFFGAFACRFVYLYSVIYLFVHPFICLFYVYLFIIHLIIFFLEGRACVSSPVYAIPFSLSMTTRNVYSPLSDHIINKWNDETLLSWPKTLLSTLYSLLDFPFSSITLLLSPFQSLLKLSHPLILSISFAIHSPFTPPLSLPPSPSLVTPRQYQTQNKSQQHRFNRWGDALRWHLWTGKERGSEGKHLYRVR